MKKNILFIVLSILLFTASVIHAEGKYGFHLGSNLSTTGFSYYTDDMRWTVGTFLGYSNTDGSSPSEKLENSVYVRNNFLDLGHDSYMGLGVTVGIVSGKESGKTIISDVHFSTNVSFEKRIADNFLVNGGFRIFKCEIKDVATTGKSTTWSVLPTFLYLSYLF
jgi:hypothetical protein